MAKWKFDLWNFPKFIETGKALLYFGERYSMLQNA